MLPSNILLVFPFPALLSQLLSVFNSFSFLTSWILLCSSWASSCPSHFFCSLSQASPVVSYLATLPMCSWALRLSHNSRGRHRLECQCSTSATPSWAAASLGWPTPWPTQGSSSSCESSVAWRGQGCCGAGRRPGGLPHHCQCGNHPATGPHETLG